MSNKAKSILVFIVGLLIGFAMLGIVRTWVGGRVDGNAGDLIAGGAGGVVGVLTYFAVSTGLSKLLNISGSKS